MSINMVSKFVILILSSTMLFSQADPREQPSFSFKEGFSKKSMTNYEWTTTDTILQTLVLTSLYIDWKQTRSMEAHGWDNPIYIEPDGTKHYHREQNLILGRKPSRRAINTYSISVAALSTYAAIKLPVGPRRILQSGILSVELYATTTNYKAGIRFTW